MRKILSVIIPVYNMEKYIRQCLESLMIREILDKIEILVVLDWINRPVRENRTGVFQGTSGICPGDQ